MKELNETPRNLRAVWVPMTLTALVMALLIAAAVTASPTQAQTPPPGNADRYPNLSTYDDPQPCGPGAGTAFMEEPHEIQTGHYALFDAYWRTIATSTASTSSTSTGGGTGPNGGGQASGSGIPGGGESPGSNTTGPGVGVLHTNECPPEMIQTTTTVMSGFTKITTTTTIRSAREGGMDIEEAIIHVLDKHKTTTVAYQRRGHRWPVVAGRVP